MTSATWQILTGDCREALRSLPAESVHTVVTSPPYFGLRDYGTGSWDGGDPACEHRPAGGRPSYADTNGASIYRGESLGGASNRAHVHGAPHRSGARASSCGCGAVRVDQQIGLEPSPDEFADAIVAVFREVRRVLRPDGTAWLNLGDSFCGSPQGNSGYGTSNLSNPARQATLAAAAGQQRPNRRMRDWEGIKPKDLVGVPWLVAFALRADGWWLRSEIIWHKSNPMPESVTDRPTKSHEQIFLLSRSGDALFWTHRDGRATRSRPTPDYVWFHPDTGEERREAMPRPWRRRNLWRGHDYYYYDIAIREADQGTDHPRTVLNGQASLDPSNGLMSPHGGIRTAEGRNGTGHNKRSVWTVATQPYPGTHFATFPPRLIEPCILAGAPERACSACGAPHVPIVERTPMVVRAAPGTQVMRAQQGEYARTQTGGTMLEAPTSRALGYAASCECDADVVPGVVLDPFAGAGTTVLQALRVNRSAIGVELNPVYAAMARERVIDDAPLLNSCAEIA